MKHLVIIGVGGFARECYWHAQGSHGYGEEWDIKGFLDGDVKLAQEEYDKLEKPVLGDVYNYEIQPEDVFICAIGDSALRRKLVAPILERGGQFINIVSRSSQVQGHVQMGVGNIICPYVVVGDHAELGNFVVLNVRSGMGHDSVAGDYSSFMGGAGLCGYAVAGENTYWATYATGLPGSKTGADVQVGVGSVVFRHVKPGLKVFGNPARPFE